MPITFELEGIPALENAWHGAKGSLAQALEGDALNAAKSGVEAARYRHPYHDQTRHLTDDATAETSSDGEAEMVWPSEYASFVDKGTSRARPFPFTPEALERAEATLEHDAEASLEHFARRIEE